MADQREPFCPECADESSFAELDRRGFIRAVGASAAAVVGAGTVLGSGRTARAAEDPKPSRPAEELVKELHASLSAEQKTKLVVAYDHGAEKGKGRATRLGMYNGPIMGKRIGENYTKPQQEVIERILKAISSDEEGYRRITRNGTFDGSHSLQGCGAVLFGEPVKGQEWSWVFSGHHLTVRCDGRPADGVGFGGPMYYGHSPNGYSDKNVFYYQTKSVLSVFDALDEKQRKAAVVVGSPGEQAPSVQFRGADQRKPGLAFAELTKDQKALVEKVMKDVLSPYRKEDVDEVMGIIKDTGGLEKIHLAFYQQKEMQDDHRWHFWRLEGPGLIWNFRVLPHVHTYVNIASKT
jgi:hypothetical protein